MICETGELVEECDYGSIAEATDCSWMFFDWDLMTDFDVIVAKAEKRCIQAVRHNPCIELLV